MRSSVLTIGATLALLASPACAQGAYGPPNVIPEAEKPLEQRAADAAAREKALLEDPVKRCKREADASREIIVCADPGKNERERLPLRNERAAARATSDGIPRAPDVFGIKDIGGVKIGGCFFPPCPPPPVYYIDMKAIPEAPPGSDADKVAKGEIKDR